MSFELTLLLIMAIAVAAVPAIRSNTVFEYPYVVGLLILGWVVPQAATVERLNLAAPFDPRITWVYMMICFLLLLFGYFLGRHYSGRPTALRPHETVDAYDLTRINRAAAVMTAIGAVSYFMMVRQAQVDNLGSEWTGVATVYAQLVNLLVYGGALAWFLYLKTGNRRSLAIAVIAALIFLPIVTQAVKREGTFQLVLIVLGGIFFCKGKSPPRAMIVIGSLCGIILLHQVAAIRTYVKNNDSTLVGAIVAGEATKEFSIFNLESATEITGAVTDISIARSADNYRPFSSMWNGLVHQYFPAFIFGREQKDALKVTRFDDGPLSARFYWRGATRTGFSDSFSDFGYFGALLFGVAGFAYGRLYRLALAGDLRFQLFYIVLLADGLMIVTESVTKLVTSLPFLLLSMWLPFRYSQIKARPGDVPEAAPHSQSYA